MVKWRSGVNSCDETLIIGDRFGKLIHSQVKGGRYSSASDMVRARLRLLEGYETGYFFTESIHRRRSVWSTEAIGSRDFPTQNEDQACALMVTSLHLWQRWISKISGFIHYASGRLGR
ncbi:type II toxin-antitoxin system ParD family antitoxin [Brucella cytisi]|uniref:type II toxin-antitoxin system ParD family antitoxin n=1 Tax=Brucella cytisi TaxID=407152 RepID=UPI0035E09F46